MQLERLTFVYQFLSQGGVEVLLRSRARELVRRGVDVQLLFLEAFGGEGLFEDMGDRVLVTGDKTEFLEALDRFEPDWVLSLDTPSVVPWVRSSYPESGLLYEVHSTYPASLAPLLDPDVLAGANGLLVPSPSQRELVKSLHTRPMPVRTVPDCLDDRFFGATEPIETGGPPIVAWIGRLDALKNWEGFIELVRLVRRRCEIEIWLIGGNKATTSEKERLERLVREYGLARDFRWRPHVESSDMPKIYKSIAARGGCLVSTSWAESFGLVVLEAMACRCPVVVPDVIGLCDLVEDRENGLVYPPIQVELGCERVVELVSSPALRASVSERAREFAGRFRRGPVVDRLVQVLECWDQGDDRDSDDGLSPFFEATRFQGGKGVLTRKRAFQAFTGQTIRAHRDHQHEVGERDGTIRGLQEELHQKVGERDKTIEHLQSRIADFELDASEVPRLAAECDTLKGEIAALTGRLEQAEEQRGEAFSQRDALKEQTAALTARMTLAEEQRGEAFSQRDALKEQ
ncbi:MAG: glycosyltransferase, partial [Rhodothermia bacterium]